MKNFKLLWLLAAACSLTLASCSKDDETPDTSLMVTFESATLSAGGYLSNQSYTEQGVTFTNKYDSQYDSWSGFAISKLHDKTTPGYPNQYSVYGDGGADGSANFAVCYYSVFDVPLTSVFAFGAGVEKKMISVMVNNSTYAALGVKDGTAFSKKFANGDWYKMILTGYNAAGTKTGAVEYYLADYRNGKTFICSSWTAVDLAPLGTVNKVEVTFASTDNNANPAYGMNNPSYACLDNLKYDNGTVAK